jgi:hypothetical protein
MSDGHAVGQDRYEGACHCGAISYVFRTALPVARWTVRECQCTFCRTHASLTTADPAGSIEFRVGRPDALHLYRFGLGTADFMLCRNCGTYLGARFTSPAGSYAIVNLRALHPLPPGLPAARAVTYDAESPEARIARREAQWTPVRQAPLEQP